MDSRSPSISAQKWLRRGFVTSESSGQKKTVWSILCALKSSTTSTIPFAMIFLPSFATVHGEECFFFVKTLKLGPDGIYWNLGFWTIFWFKKTRKNIFGFNLSVDFNLSGVGDIPEYPSVRICVGIRICVGLPYSRITVLTLTGIFGDAFFFRVLLFENFFGSCETGGHD